MYYVLAQMWIVFKSYKVFFVCFGEGVVSEWDTERSWLPTSEQQSRSHKQGPLHLSIHSKDQWDAAPLQIPASRGGAPGVYEVSEAHTN